MMNKMWLKPKANVGDLSSIWEYAITIDGYEYTKQNFGIECGDLANAKMENYRKNGFWNGSFEELRCCLFFEQRRAHMSDYEPQGYDLVAIQALYLALVKRWQMETEDE